ncbi:hypothetical protein NDU88_006749 [Pleurodeles waltl]|uniref:Ubiquinone biosynthesis accessory factor UbiK n=1 Tax=Pleurodeles waltl TaxID=8319 RepID=A0AAV7QM31_PLEWA|nr:hypothetical protein NDU88_006749 [Pleurodeles waltl]
MLATPTLVDLIRQLESTLEKHTVMFVNGFHAIQDFKTAMEAQLEATQIETGLLLADHAKLNELVDETEFTLTSLRTTVLALQDQLKTLKKEGERA